MPANAVALVALLGGLTAGAISSIEATGRFDADYYPTPAATAAGASGLRMDGKVVSNMFTFDQQGRPLANVRLYDASGRPLNLHYKGCARAGAGTTWLDDNVYPKPATTRRLTEPGARRPRRHRSSSRR